MGIVELEDLTADYQNLNNARNTLYKNIGSAGEAKTLHETFGEVYNNMIETTFLKSSLPASSFLENKLPELEEFSGGFIVLHAAVKAKIEAYKGLKATLEEFISFF